MREVKSVASTGFLVEWQEVESTAYNNCEGDVPVVDRCVNVKHVIGASLVPSEAEGMPAYVLIVTAGGKLRVHGTAAMTECLYDHLFKALKGV